MKSFYSPVTDGFIHIWFGTAVVNLAKDQRKLIFIDEAVTEIPALLIGLRTESSLASQGMDTANTAIRIPGASLGIAPGGIEVPIVDGGTTIPGPTKTFTAFDFGYISKDGDFVAIGVARNLVPFTATEIGQISTDLSGASYERFVGLLDNDSKIIGTGFADRIEVGAGDDVVNAKAGDDVVFKWSPGDMAYRGGKGRDALFFETDQGNTAFPNAFAQQMVVDLAKGTGKNPYGGDLTLNSVEVIHDTTQGDRVLGSKADERVISDRGGGNDVFRTKGGNDDFQIAVTLVGTVVDGGAGDDSLQVWNIGAGAHRLDLRTPANSIGIFADAKVSGIETFRFDVISNAAAIEFNGSTGAEAVSFQNFFNRDATLTVRLDDGDDIATGGFGNDVLKGGRGRDILTGLDGDDRLLGGTAGDMLTGGAGNDRMTGGGGRDHFIFASDFGRDQILDYEDGIDKIDLSGHSGVAGFKDLEVRDTALGVAVLDGDGGRINLVGIENADVDKSDFLF